MEALEEERNKVNEFYEKREAEFMQRGDSLLHQLHTLLLHKTSVSLPDKDVHQTKRSHAKARTSVVNTSATSLNCKDIGNAPPWNDGTLGSNDRSFNRKDIQRAEKTIRGAFVDLYRALGLLNKFR